MEKSKREQFDRKFAAFVGKLPFPGRHTVGPAAVHALRTPNIDEKLADRQRIAGFRRVNRMVGGLATLSTVLDVYYMYPEGPTLLTSSAFFMNGLVATASFASARAQSFLIDRVDHSIEAARSRSGPWEVGIEAEPTKNVAYTQRWPVSVEKRDSIVHGAVCLGATGLQMGIVAQEIMSQIN